MRDHHCHPPGCCYPLPHRYPDRPLCPVVPFRLPALRTGLAAVVLATWLGACGISSIDSVKSKQLDLCKTIKGEHERMLCITGVKSDG